jgi:hypothetical protein
MGGSLKSVRIPWICTTISSTVTTLSSTESSHWDVNLINFGRETFVTVGFFKTTLLNFILSLNSSRNSLRCLQIVQQLIACEVIVFDVPVQFD